MASGAEDRSDDHIEAFVTRWAAGCGVIADSDLEAEFQESCNKARALIRAAEEAVRFARSSQ